MQDIIDLDAYPIDQPGTQACGALVARCRRALDRDGMFDLAGFLRPAALAQALGQVAALAGQAHTHARDHNIYFRKDIPGLAPDHPALKPFRTVNHTLCADQIGGGVLTRLYEAPAFAGFLAACMEKPALFTMEDPLARLNVMTYRTGEALNWHFDRSEFTTTILLQAPDQGGLFEFRSDLRGDEDPNFDGVARLLAGQDPDVQRVKLMAGGLNVFRGRNTAHRVTPVIGPTERKIAVFSFYDRPGVRMSAEDQKGFYGRAA